MNLTPNQLDDFSSLAFNIGGEIYEDYSGRGMFGKACMGITVDELENSLFRLGKQSSDYEFSKELENFRTDNMGKSFIIYFPQIQNVVDNSQ